MSKRELTVDILKEKLNRAITSGRPMPGILSDMSKYFYEKVLDWIKSCENELSFKYKILTAAGKPIAYHIIDIETNLMVCIAFTNETAQDLCNYLNEVDSHV